MDAKDYAILQKQMIHLDESNPEHKEFLIKDAIKSMKEKVQKFGTSQDPSEWVEPPVYSESTTYRGFAVMISFYKNKYIGLARQLEPLVTGGHLVNFQSDPYPTAHEAGANVFKLIDIFRKPKKGLI